ncbi:hypothetical protein EJ110_NYTH44477 [Nymphaea thermarum]|nr:hypothetical protein EJ110_NYTH44477 [Nymphaea thermarum]
MKEEALRDDSSSGEEDGDEEWRSAINSIAVDASVPSLTVAASQKTRKKNHGEGDDTHSDSNGDEDAKPRPPNPHKLKVLNMLDDFLDRNLVFVKKPITKMKSMPEQDEGGVRLFGRAPPGLTFKTDTVLAPRRRPKILPYEEIDERSKEFKRRIRSVAVDGADVFAAAEVARQSALARFESRLAAEREAAKREEARVAELKRLRGEKWLPSMGKQMRRTC